MPAGVKHTRQKVKALILFSGGLDSTLALKVILDQGVDTEAVHFTTPFCLCDKCAVTTVSKEFGIKLHTVFLGQEFLDLIVDPPHGYGSQMNPCVDCRILMFRHAKRIAEKIGAEFIVTGEVLNERPFSQRRKNMLMIEKKAGLEGKILRPLSAKLLPETEAEKKGLISREKLFQIRGRRRLPQMRLADELGITDYPCPSGGCLLTDPQFADRLRDYLKYNPKPMLRNIELLRLGRHFRVEGSKIIVGRNEKENQSLLSISKREEIPYLEVAEYVGPITLLVENRDEGIVKKAAAITVRYSDAPKGVEVDVRYTSKTTRTLRAKTTEDRAIEEWRV